MSDNLKINLFVVFCMLACVGGLHAYTKYKIWSYTCEGGCVISVDEFKEALRINEHLIDMVPEYICGESTRDLMLNPTYSHEVSYNTRIIQEIITMTHNLRYNACVHRDVLKFLTVAWEIVLRCNYTSIFSKTIFDFAEMYNTGKLGAPACTEKKSPMHIPMDEFVQWQFMSGYYDLQEREKYPSLAANTVPFEVFEQRFCNVSMGFFIPCKNPADTPLSLFFKHDTLILPPKDEMIG